MIDKQLFTVFCLFNLLNISFRFFYWERMSAMNHQQRREQKLNLLNTMYDEDLCDVTFIIGKERTQFQANRVFLASISPVFKAMLYGKMLESKQNSEIEIVDVEATAFEQILRYSYCNNPHLTPKNIIAIRTICEKYQISLISDICDGYFKNCIKKDNVCLLLSQSIEAKLECYVTIIQQKLMEISGIGSHANEIIKSSAFLELTLNAMIIFLQSDALHVQEEDLWEAVQKWAHYQSSDKTTEDSEQKNQEHEIDLVPDPDVRLALMKSVAPFIRFGLMDGEYFAKTVKPSNILSLQEVTDVACYILANDPNAQCGEFSTKSRQPGIHELEYALSMSSCCPQTFTDYTLLSNADYLDTGCGTKRQINPWIEFIFAGEVDVREIHIGPPAKDMPGEWGVQYLNNANLEYLGKNGVWNSLWTIGMNYEIAHKKEFKIRTRAMRIINHSKNECYLGIGCFKVFGFSNKRY